MPDRIKVLIVDDSALMRKVLKEILVTDREIEVVGTARDGEDAIEKVRDLKPDVVTMDINMPVMDGLTSMQYIANDFPDIPVIIVSSLTEEGAMITFEALELGAFDYVAKPSGTVSSNLYVVGREIIQKVKLAYHSANKKNIRDRIDRRGNTVVKSKITTVSNSIAMTKEVTKVVVIGISTGGPSTLMVQRFMTDTNFKRLQEKRWTAIIKDN